MWAQDPSGDWTTILNWEPRTDEFWQALQEVLASGAAVFIRQGSGGRSVGIAIWDGDDRMPARWCFDDEEINMWSAEIIRRAAQLREKKTE